MFCLYCGNNLPDDALFCNKCGKQQKPFENTSTPGAVILPTPSLPNAPLSAGQPTPGNVPMVQGTPQVGGIPSIKGAPSAPMNAPAGNAAASPLPSSGSPSMPSQSPSPASPVDPSHGYDRNIDPRHGNSHPLHMQHQHTERPDAEPEPSPDDKRHPRHHELNGNEHTGLKVTGHLSRRAVITGLGVAGLAIVGGGIALISRRTLTSSGPSATSTPTLPPPPIGTTILTYRGHSSTVSSVAWSPDGKYIASGSYLNKAQVFDATTGTNILTYRGNADEVFVVAWSPNGKRIASVGGANATGADGKPVPQDDTVQVWDALTGRNVLIYRDHTSWVQNLVWSPDGTRIASSAVTESTVKIWDSSTANTIFTYEGQSNEIIVSIAWSPNGQYIASAGYTGTGQSGTTQVWDASTGANILAIPNNLGDLAWSPDSKNIASTANSKIQIWDASTGVLVKDMGDSSNAFVVAWSHDGKHIAFGGGDRSTNKFPIQVVNAITGDHIFTYNGHSNFVFAIAWAPDDRRIASGSDDATVQVWEAI